MEYEYQKSIEYLQSLGYFKEISSSHEDNCIILGCDAAYNNTLSNVSHCFNITIVPDNILELKGNESKYDSEKFLISLNDNEDITIDSERNSCKIFIQDNDCELQLLRE